jgi:hypothetical protein
MVLAKSIVAAAVFTLAAAVPMLPAVPASADSPLHHVRYIVTAETLVDADIYYRDADPVDFAAYSHNPYEFSPKADVVVGPDRTWILDAMLADPHQWAMVIATSGPGPLTPNFHCVLEVDGMVAKSSGGAKGTLCSLRSW